MRRRRECTGCNFRFTTYEYIEVASITVIKKDGRRESFDRYKILNGITRACEKRPVDRELIEKIGQDIEHELIASGQKEVQSFEIGQRVLERLKDLDEIAYIRFASVYRAFSDIKDFEEVVNSLNNKN